MNLLPSRLCGKDIDYVMAYPTVKMVNIQDARLGVLKIALLFAITIYIAVFQLWRDGGYLATEKVSGVARFTLQQPTIDSEGNPNCDPKNANCYNDFDDPSTLPYCAQSTLPYVGNKYDCQFYENVGVLHTFESSIVVDTRITSRKENLVCQASTAVDEPGTTCPVVYNTTGEETTNYGSNIGLFTVLFDTSVTATSLGITGQSADMEGWLYVADNDAFCDDFSDARSTWGGAAKTNESPCYVMPNKTSANLDFFQLEILMNAAGSSLDYETSTGSGETFREAGVTLIMQVDYTNTLSWAGASDAIQYTYTPYLLPSTSFKMYEAEYDGVNNYRENRTLLNKHGVKLDLVQSGYLGKFSFSQLLVSLTTSLTLLAMATLVTDYVALYLLPDKEKYDEAKYEWTEDFSDMRDEERVEKRMSRQAGRSSRSASEAEGRQDSKVGQGSSLSEPDLKSRLLDSEEHRQIYGHSAGNRDTSV